MAPKLLIVIASTRPGRAGPVVGDWVEQAARAHGAFEVSVCDLAALDLPLLDEANHPARAAYEKDHTKRWSAIAGAADAFVFVTPEYDFFPPATVVNALQCLSREWKYKAAGVVSYGGVSGGLRAAQELRTLIGNLSMVALPQVVPLPFFAEHITDGAFTANTRMEEGAALMLGELAKWSAALLPMRAG